MKSFFVVVLAGAAMWLISSPAWAEKAYVTDSVEITFRTGPGTGNKILSFLRSGQEVEVLESRDNWVRVRVPGRGRDTAEGWVLKRYLMRRQPWEARAVSLEKENAALSERLSLAERDRRRQLGGNGPPRRASGKTWPPSGMPVKNTRPSGGMPPGTWI